jgi:hypothetical protein
VLLFVVLVQDCQGVNALDSHLVAVLVYGLPQALMTGLWPLLLTVAVLSQRPLVVDACGRKDLTPPPLLCDRERVTALLAAEPQGVVTDAETEMPLSGVAKELTERL